MTSQEKKKWLNRYSDKDKEINHLLDERAGWWAKVTDITPKYSDMPKAAPNDNKVQAAIEKVIEIEEEVNDKIDELVKIKEEIESAISIIPDAACREVLAEKYLKKMNFGAISKQFKCSRHKIYNIHDKAIEELFS